MLSSGNNCTVTKPCPTHRSAAAGRSGDAECAFRRLTSCGTQLASRLYCKGCHSRNTSHVLFAQWWCLEAPLARLGGMTMLPFPLGWGIFQRWRNSIFLSGVSAWWAGAAICSSWGSSSVPEPLEGGKGLNSGERTDEMMS